MTYIIGMMGLRGAGKDTAAKMLRDELTARGVTVALDSFAAPLRSLATAVFGFDCSGETDRHRRHAQVPVEDLREAYEYWDDLIDDLSEGKSADDYRQVADALDRLASEIDDQETLSAIDFMMHVGQGLRRLVGESVWIDAALSRADGRLDADVTILTDVRMENEIEICDRILFVHRHAPRVEDFKNATERLAAEMAQAVADCREWPVEGASVMCNTASLDKLNSRVRAYAHAVIAGESYGD